MVDIKDQMKFAFSTIFTPDKELEDLNVLKIDSRMFRGIKKEVPLKIDEFMKFYDNPNAIKNAGIKKALERSEFSKKEIKKIFKNGVIPLTIYERGLGIDGIRKISENFAGMNRLGTFLNKIQREPEKLAEKIKGKSVDDFKRYLKMGKDAYKEIKETIKRPKSIVKNAINQCFDLYDIDIKNVKKLHNHKDRSVLYMDDSREMSLTFRRNDDIKEMNSLPKNISKSRKFGFEVEWVIFNFDWDKWDARFIKLSSSFISGAIGYLIPGVGGIISSIIKKGIKKKTDDMLKNQTNGELKLIFFDLIKANLAIENIKFQPFEYINENGKKLKKGTKSFHSSIVAT